MATFVLSLGLIVLLAHFFEAISEKTRIPDVLPLVFVGVLVGPVLGLVTSESLGRAGTLFTFISLVVILFESGVGLDFSTLQDAMLRGMRLTIVNFLASVAVVAVLGIGRLSWVEALILGAILGGTSSAVVIPMIGRIPLDERSRTILILESTFSDVLCIVVTLALIQALRSHQLEPGLMAGRIISSFSLAAATGILGALFWSTLLDRIREMENAMFSTPAFVLVIYGISELLGYSGAIAALAFGVTLGNVGLLQARLPAALRLGTLRPHKLNSAEKSFFSQLVFLLKTFFFLYIGISIQLGSLFLTGLGLGIVASLYAARILVVRLSLPLDTKRFDAAVAWAIVPKGLAAAALATLPAEAGIAGGHAIQNIVYAAILFSVIASALFSFMAEHGWLSGAASVLLAKYAGAAKPPQDAKS